MSFNIHEMFDSLAKTNSTVAVLGSMNADYTVETQRLPGPGETVSGGPLNILPGGKSANQASSASLMGARVNMLGAVGDDANGAFLLERLRAAGVHTGAVQRVSGPSGTTVITVDAHAENTIVYSAGANTKVDANYVMRMLPDIENARVLGLCLESPMAAVVAAARIAKDQGMTVLLNNSPFQSDLPRELVEDADVLLVNEHEMSQMLDMSAAQNNDWRRCNWTEAAERMDAYGFDQAIVTLGAEGAYVLSSLLEVRRRTFHATYVPAQSVKAVDTTGCGDAFMGAVLAGLAAGSDLVDAARLGSYVAAYAATGLGAQSSYGNRTQIEAMFVASDSDGS